jgi:hypothetical protein
MQTACRIALASLFAVGLSVVGIPLVLHWDAHDQLDAGGSNCTLRTEWNVEGRALHLKVRHLVLDGSGRPNTPVVDYAYYLRHAHGLADRVLINMGGLSICVTDEGTGSRRYDVWIPMWVFCAFLFGGCCLGLRSWLVRHLRLARGLCVRCGYNLRANVSGVCPECGASIPGEESESGTSPPGATTKSGPTTPETRPNPRPTTTPGT